MIHEEDFDLEITRIYEKIVKDDYLSNKINKLRFYINITADFENDSLKVSMDYCSKYNFIMRMIFKWQNKVPYIIEEDT